MTSGLGLRGIEFLNHSKNIGWLPSCIEQTAWNTEPRVWLFLDNHSLNLGANYQENLLDYYSKNLLDKNIPVDSIKLMLYDIKANIKIDLKFKYIFKALVNHRLYEIMADFGIRLKTKYGIVLRYKATHIEEESKLLSNDFQWEL